MTAHTRKADQIKLYLVFMRYMAHSYPVQIAQYSRARLWCGRMEISVSPQVCRHRVMAMANAGMEISLSPQVCRYEAIAMTSEVIELYLSRQYC